MRRKVITVFGGSGFLGQSVVARLAAAGHRIRVATRRPNEAMICKPMGDVGQVELVQADVTHPGSVQYAVQGADIVINLVGILFQRGHQKFDAVQNEGARHVAEAAAAAGATALVHVSALGANRRSHSKYQKSKAHGEVAVHRAFPSATILRPSVMFGPDDGFFNKFGRLVALAPVLPVPGLETRFQPIFVGDVADAVCRAAMDPHVYGNETFELGGEDILTLRQILEKVMAEVGVDKPLIPVPLGLARIQAFFWQLIPAMLPFFFDEPLITVDQVRSLEYDNVVSSEVPGIDAFSITPTPMDAVLPTYMVQYRKYGQFAHREG